MLIKLFFLKLLYNVAMVDNISNFMCIRCRLPRAKKTEMVCFRCKPAVNRRYLSLLGDGLSSENLRLKRKILYKSAEYISTESYNK